ncbi:FKBP-type peptidyl-prolyl cis-trans isomerase [Porticoccaceae bacterium LTM1]|nr:FKBP-type peptidyl-prolyl cis-trans isomerase [Porticoccaceae bacterium LTM1]
MAFETQIEKISYAIGTDIGRQLQSQELELDAAALSAAICDTLNGAEPQLSGEEINAAMTALMEQQQAKQQRAAEAAAAAGEENRKAGEAFLAENAQRDEVVVLESGLQYEIITEGTGDKPGRDSTVEVHYAGTLINGNEFDSSIKRGQPASFGVTQVIAGWTEGLQLMPEGSKWRFFIPADLAYGDRAMGPHLPAGSTLIFEVELLKANI